MAGLTQIEAVGLLSDQIELWGPSQDAGQYFLDRFDRSLLMLLASFFHLGFDVGPKPVHHLEKLPTRPGAPNELHEPAEGLDERIFRQRRPDTLPNHSSEDMEFVKH